MFSKAASLIPPISLYGRTVKGKGKGPASHVPPDLFTADELEDLTLPLDTDSVAMPFAPGPMLDDLPPPPAHVLAPPQPVTTRASVVTGHKHSGGLPPSFTAKVSAVADKQQKEKSLESVLSDRRSVMGDDSDDETVVADEEWADADGEPSTSRPSFRNPSSTDADSYLSWYAKERLRLVKKYMVPNTSVAHATATRTSLFAHGSRTDAKLGAVARTSYRDPYVKTLRASADRPTFSEYCLDREYERNHGRATAARPSYTDPYSKTGRTTRPSYGALSYHGTCARATLSPETRVYDPYAKTGRGDTAARPSYTDPYAKSKSATRPSYTDPYAKATRGNAGLAATQMRTMRLHDPYAKTNRVATAVRPVYTDPYAKTNRVATAARPSYNEYSLSTARVHDPYAKTNRKGTHTRSNVALTATQMRTSLADMLSEWTPGAATAGKPGYDGNDSDAPLCGPATTKSTSNKTASATASNTRKTRGARQVEYDSDAPLCKKSSSSKQKKSESGEMTSAKASVSRYDSDYSDAPLTSKPKTKPKTLPKPKILPKPKVVPKHSEIIAAGDLSDAPLCSTKTETEPESETKKKTEKKMAEKKSKRQAKKASADNDSDSDSDGAIIGGLFD